MTPVPEMDPTRTELPLRETVAGAYRSVFVENRGHLPRALCVPFLLSLALSLWALHVTEFGMVRSSGLSAVVIGLLWRAVFSIPFVIFAVSWHRLILLGPKEGRPTLWPALGTRHMSFFGYVIVAALIFFLFGELLSTLVIIALLSNLPPGFDFQLGLVVGLSLFFAGIVHEYALFGSTIFVGFGNGLTMPSANVGVMSVRDDLAAAVLPLSFHASRQISISSESAIVSRTDRSSGQVPRDR